MGLYGVSPLAAQTELGGTINVYARPTAQDPCQNTITLANAAGFTAGMGIVVLQMNGAAISTANSAAYGDVTNLNGAGLYEWNEIAAVSGNTLTLTHRLLNDYATEYTQVIGFQIYTDAIVNNPVTAPAWDGNTGGVVVIAATNQLDIASPIDVAGRGFRGGQPESVNDNNCNWLLPQTAYAYNRPNWRGAPKGEGIAPNTASTGNGRGAQANGGGGGNDHNTGGGGGGLVSTGGAGGVNEEPSTFGCRGVAPGVGGKALPTGTTRIYLGGGGGTGHANNGSASRGGDGGGIIIIRTERLVFSGGSLLANGNDGGSAVGDGAGGGGAGGSILIVADEVVGTPNLQARGGDGGQVNNGNVDRCFGPGGGGSGGWVRSSIPMTADTNGGSAGLTTNSTSCNNGTNGAQAGTNGVQSTAADLAMGTPFVPAAFVSITPDTTVCSGSVATLEAVFAGDVANYQWQTWNNGEWINIPDAAAATYTYSANLAGTFRVLGQTQSCDPPVMLMSESVTVSVANPVTALPTFTLDGNVASFQANATGSDATLEWLWNDLVFGEGATAALAFPGPGTYNILLELNGDCTEATYPLVVVIAEPLVAAIAANRLRGCAPMAVVFTDESLGTVSERSWQFEGGEPNTGVGTTEMVVFATPGMYTISLTVGNGTASATTTVEVEVLTPPLPDFSFEADGLQVVFLNTSQNATDFTWNFGDGTSSNEANPIHTYPTGGVYEVTLSAANADCGVAVSQTVAVMAVGTTEPISAGWRMAPNPTRGEVHIDFGRPVNGQLTLYDMGGRQVLHHILQSALGCDLNLDHLPTGTYAIRLLETDGRSTTRRILVAE